MCISPFTLLEARLWCHGILCQQHRPLLYSSTYIHSPFLLYNDFFQLCWFCIEYINHVACIALACITFSTPRMNSIIKHAYQYQHQSFSRSCFLVSHQFHFSICELYSPWVSIAYALFIWAAIKPTGEFLTRGLWVMFRIDVCAK